MRTHSPATLGGIVTVFALVVGCSSTTAGFGAAQSTPPVTSAATVLEQTTVTQTQTLTQTTTVQTTTAQPSTAQHAGPAANEPGFGEFFRHLGRRDP